MRRRYRFIFLEKRPLRRRIRADLVLLAKLREHAEGFIDSVRHGYVYGLIDEIVYKVYTFIDRIRYYNPLLLVWAHKTM